MAKSNGLGDALFFNGYDLSGDVGSVQVLKSSLAAMDVTALNKSAHERIAGLRDGAIDFKAFYNRATSQEHPVLDLIPTTDLIVVYCRGTTLGNPSAAMVGKQFNFSENRTPAGLLEDSVSFKANAHGLDWGEQLTAGQRTDTAATNGTGIQRVSGLPATTAITSVAVANPGQVNSVAHGLVTGDSVLIAGTTTTPSINARYTVTVVSANQFTIPVNVTSGQAGAAGTVQKTSTDFGWAAYLNVFAPFAGTDVTVTVQDSADDVTYANLTGGAFTSVTAAPTAERIAGGSTAIVREYVRVKTTTSAGFTSAIFAVTFVRYYTSISD